MPKKQVCRSFAPFFIAAICLLAAAGGAQEIPLAEQLEGLPVNARIAYVRHLISSGKGGPECYFQLALAFHESGAADSAIYYYRKTISEDPGHYKSMVNLGVLFDEEGEYIEAEMRFRAALAIKPDDVLANSHLAFMLFQHKKYDQAWDHLSRALADGPGHPQPHFYLAIFFWENRIYREAMKEWEKVIELAPRSYLASKAQENITMLQKAMNAPPSDGAYTPSR